MWPILQSDWCLQNLCGNSQQKLYASATRPLLIFIWGLGNEALGQLHIASLEDQGIICALLLVCTSEKYVVHWSDMGHCTQCHVSVI